MPHAAARAAPLACVVLMLLLADAVLAMPEVAAGSRRALLRTTTTPAAPASSRRHLLGGGFFDVPQCVWAPTSGNSQPDSEGRLWGWETGRSCAYRMGSRPLFYTGFEPGNWVTVPACRAQPFASDAVMDSKFKTWAWESGRLCAYKDDQLQPVSITKRPARLEWGDAPSCASAPGAKTAAPDKLGRLWGWELNRNCAFKASDGTPLYYAGYTGPTYVPSSPSPSPSPSPVPSPLPLVSSPAPGDASSGSQCNTTSTEDLAQAVADRLWKKMQDATNGYDAPLDLQAAAREGAATALANKKGGQIFVAAAQVEDQQPADNGPGATPLETVGAHHGIPLYVDPSQVQALHDPDTPPPPGLAGLTPTPLPNLVTPLPAASPTSPVPSPVATPTRPTTSAPSATAPPTFIIPAASPILAKPLPTLALISPAPVVKISPPPVVVPIQPVVSLSPLPSVLRQPSRVTAEVVPLAAPVLARPNASKTAAPAKAPAPVPTTKAPAPAAKAASPLLAPAAGKAPKPAANVPTAGDFVVAEGPSSDAVPQKPGTTDGSNGPIIVGDTLAKPAAGVDAASGDVTKGTQEAPTAIDAGTTQASRSLVQLLTDGGPGGASPPGTSGTGGRVTDTPIPPDAKFATIAAAEATKARPPANPSKIREPTDSYSPGGVTPPGTHGSRRQLTLLPSASGDFGAASGEGSFEYAPMGPTSRGGRYSRSAPGTRIMPRPAERSKGAAADPASPAADSKPVIGPGAAKAETATLRAAPVVAPTRTLLGSGARIPGVRRHLMHALQQQEQQVAQSEAGAAVPGAAARAATAAVGDNAQTEAAATASANTTTVALSGASANATSDAAAGTVAARAAAFSYEATNTTSAASANASASSNVTNPDGSWSYSWSNSTASSWSSSWNSSWSAAWSEANATAAPGSDAAANATAEAAAAAGPGGAAAEAGARAAALGAPRVGGARRMLRGDPWSSAKRCQVVPGGLNTVANVTRDENGRYWGFQGGSSCAFRGVDVAALKYSERAPYDSPTFQKAPPCPAGAPNTKLAADGHSYAWDPVARVTCTWDKKHPSRVGIGAPAGALQQASAAPTAKAPATTNDQPPAYTGVPATSVASEQVPVAALRPIVAPGPASAVATPKNAAPADLLATTTLPATTGLARRAPGLLSTIKPLSKAKPAVAAATIPEDTATFSAAELPASLPSPTVAAGVVSVAALTKASAVASSLVAEATGEAAKLMRSVDDQVQQALSGENMSAPADRPTSPAATPAVTTSSPDLPRHVIPLEAHWREIQQGAAPTAGSTTPPTAADDDSGVYPVDEPQYDYEAPSSASPSPSPVPASSQQQPASVGTAAPTAVGSLTLSMGVRIDPPAVPVAPLLQVPASSAQSVAGQIADAAAKLRASMLRPSPLPRLVGFQLTKPPQ